MKTYPLDYSLRALEKIMDTRSECIEDIPEYLTLCEYLTCLDMGLSDELPIAHDDVFDVFKSLVAKILPDWVGAEMEFHRKCQPDNV